MFTREAKSAFKPVSGKSYNDKPQSSYDVGNYILKPASGAALWNPSWNEQSSAETVLRILPALDEENPGKFLPTHLSDDTLSTWILRYDAVSQFGNFGMKGASGISMILHPDDNDPEYNPKMENPFWIILNSITNACKNAQDQPGWSSLIPSNFNRQVPFSAPRRFYFVQCFLFRHNGKNQFKDGRPPRGSGAEDPTIVMKLQATAGSALLKIMDQKVADWDQDPDDPKRFVADPVAVHPGAFVHIYSRGNDPREANNTEAVDPYAVKASQNGPAGMMPKGLDVFLTETLDGGPRDLPASLLGREALVCSKVKPWDKLIAFYDDKEQAHIICKHFMTCPDANKRRLFLSAIEYAFRGRRDWLLDDVKIALTGRTSVNMDKPVVSRNDDPTVSKELMYPPLENVIDPYLADPNVEQELDKETSVATQERPAPEANGEAELTDMERARRALQEAQDRAQARKRG